MAAFSGIWCASVTPLHEDLSVDGDRFESHVRHLLADGCDGVAVFGSTGEGNSFSVQERIEAVHGLARRGVPTGRLIVGAGACAAPDVVAVARAAHDVGAAGLLVLPPFYYRHASDGGLLAFFDRVVEGMAGRTVPIVLYHFPKLAGIGFGPELVARLHETWPGVFVGLKDSSGDLARMAAIAADLPDVSVLAGTERLLLPLLERGGAGCLTATTNLTAALARRVFDTRDRSLHERLVAAREALETAPFVPGIKHRMARETGDPGWNRVRPPLAAAPADVLARLDAAVRAAPYDGSA